MQLQNLYSFILPFCRKINTHERLEVDKKLTVIICNLILNHLYYLLLIWSSFIPAELVCWVRVEHFEYILVFSCFLLYSEVPSTKFLIFTKASLYSFLLKTYYKPCIRYNYVKLFVLIKNLTGLNKTKFCIKTKINL